MKFSEKERNNVICRNIEIRFRDDDLIKISKEEITGLVKAADKDIIGRELRAINADRIEKEVEKHKAILKAEVYKVTTRDSNAYSGILGVKVMHRIPVVRIMSSSGSYFLDKNSEKVPLSVNYTANVLVITGYFTEEFAREELLPFVLYIDRNPFWKALIQQLYVEKNGDIFLTPLIGDNKIELGSLENYQEKLVNLKAFYDQVLANNNWNKYETVSLKYKDQVIAKKR